MNARRDCLGMGLFQGGGAAVKEGQGARLEICTFLFPQHFLVMGSLANMMKVSLSPSPSTPFFSGKCVPMRA